MTDLAPGETWRVGPGDASPGDPRDASRLTAVQDDASRPPGSHASRLCGWCTAPIPLGKRVDAQTCSTSCRQARHRFKVAVGPGPCDRPLRLAYADPPYPGLARRYYGEEEVDHAALIRRLCSYDGWALSTSAVALAGVLQLCPEGTRVCAWVKGARGARAHSALSAWEPLLVFGGRPRRVAVVEDLHDVLVWGGRQHSHPGALVGMKPAAFAEWMFRLLGARQGDVLDDLYPGSGAIGRAWRIYTSHAASHDASAASTHDTSRLAAATPPGPQASLLATHDATHAPRA